MQSVSSDARVVDAVDDSLWHEPWDNPDVARQQLALVYQELGRWLAGESIKPFDVFMELLSHCTVTLPVSVLELGCGVGHYGQVIKVSGKTGYFYRGVDCSTQMVSWGTKGFGANIRLGNAENMVALSRSNDVVVLGSVLNHTPNWEKVAAEAKRISRKYIMLHRMPMGPKTVLTQKQGYGVEMAERHFKEDDLMEPFADWEVVDTRFWSWTGDSFQASYLLVKA